MVSAMAITAKYIIVCDEVRREDNGKFLIIGAYTPDLSVPQIPFVMPSISFFVCLESDRPGISRFDVSISHLETGSKVNNAVGMGQMQFDAPGLAIAPIRFANVQFNAGGAYIFSLSIVNQPEPITAQFSVILNIPGVGGPPARLT